MKNGKIKKVLKSKTFACAVTGIVFLNIGGVMASTGNVNTQDIQNKLDKEVALNHNLEDKNKNLEKKVNEAKPWFEMNNEKKKQEEEKLAQQKAKDEQVKKEKEQKEQQTREEKEKQGYNTGITYDQIARNPDQYKDQKVQFRGKVIQVMQGDGFTQLRIAVDDNYDTILLATIPNAILKNGRVLENDELSVYGTSSGLVTYKSTLGGDITIPAILVDKTQR